MATNNSILYLLSYNNYFNRRVLREAAIGANVNAYSSYFVYEPLVCNFNPADGIDTEHIFNVPYIANTPAADYCVVTDTKNKIVSRWFIVNATRERGGQYKLSLHRDLIVDFYDQVLAAPCFIERATVFINNPLIFQSEGMSFNQIKKDEKPLRDATGTGWYVGYIANDTPQTTVTVKLDASTNYPTSPIPYSTAAGLVGIFAAQPVYTITAGATLPNPSSTAHKYRVIRFTTEGNAVSFSDNTGSAYETKDSFSQHRTASEDAQSAATAIAAASATVIPALNAEYTTNPIYSQATLQTLQGMSGQTYYDPTANKYFYCNLIKLISSRFTKTLAENTNAYTTTRPIIISACQMSTSAASSSPYLGLSIEANMVTYQWVVADITNTQTATATIEATVPSLSDAPYKMFAIPAKDFTIGFTTNPSLFYASNEVSARLLANAVAVALGGTGAGSRIYDLQYLPYCPIRGNMVNGALILNGLTGVTLLKAADQNQTVYSYMLWATTSNFSFEIEEPIYVYDTTQNFKIAHETKFCRLVSPNYSGVFEFKPTSNYGVDRFEVNCTYKPYQPYIHVNPKFTQEGLYGGDYNDQRGLVCSGDFSLPIVTDAWTTYQINNASYKDAFARSVENMETNYEIQRKQQKTAGIIGAVSAGLSGAGSGAIAGSVVPGVGTAVGAAAGLVAGAAASIGSGIGAVADLRAADALHAEAKSYATDQFNYNLQNIKALSYSLGKVGAQSIDYKVFPFVEFYGATDAEEAALRNKIRYNAFTIGAIGTLGEYENYKLRPRGYNFMQGSIIRIDDLDEDYHCAAAIANEIHKGVYL